MDLPVLDTSWKWNRKVQYVARYVQPLSLSIMFAVFIHIIARVSAKYSPHGCTHCIGSGIH